jgi:hypothetical protein
MVYVGPVAKSVGMDVEQTASAIGILSNAGIGGKHFCPVVWEQAA